MLIFLIMNLWPVYTSPVTYSMDLASKVASKISWSLCFPCLGQGVLVVVTLWSGCVADCVDKGTSLPAHLCLCLAKCPLIFVHAGWLGGWMECR